MRPSAVAGLVFANKNDDLLPELTDHRSMASVPFGARYRLVDFAISNLVCAGAKTVGLITKENYRSLMDHIGSGIYWDLDRKSGGLYFLPPYSSRNVKRYSGSIDALAGAREFIERCYTDCIAMCNADLAANVDIAAALDRHFSTGADVTVVYQYGKVPVNHGDTMLLTRGENDRITHIDFNRQGGFNAEYGLGVTIIGRELLLSLIDEAYSSELRSLNCDVFAKKVNQLKIYGFMHKGFAAVMDGTESYYNANMKLLETSERRCLFDPSRPVLTKTRDGMPTRYGIRADVCNSLIADGCVIEGTVKNSILFREVKVEKGAVVEDCILMQGTTVSANAHLSRVISDKNAVIGSNMVLKGNDGKCFFVKKNQIL